MKLKKELQGIVQLEFLACCVLAELCHTHTSHLSNQPIQKVLIPHCLVYNIWPSKATDDNHPLR